jgi:hypothetical protein
MDSDSLIVDDNGVCLDGVLVMFFYDKAEGIDGPYTVVRAIGAFDGEFGKGI